MSNRSAFDVLMSSSQTTQAKKNKQQSSPMKRKFENPTIINTREELVNPRADHEELKKKRKLENPSEETIHSEALVLNEPSVVVSSVDREKQHVTIKNVVSELEKKSASFDVNKPAYWGKGNSVPFMFVAKAMDTISTTASTTMRTNILCNVLRTVLETTPGDLLTVFYLLSNKIVDSTQEERGELGIGDATIVEALGKAYGNNKDHIMKQLKVLGDLGLVAKASRSSQPSVWNRKPQPLTVAKVLDTYRSIAEESGKDSQEKTKDHIKKLLVAATDCEPQYLIRMLQRNLRIGVAEQTILAALGHAAVYSENPSSSSKKVEEAAKIVKQAYSATPVCDKIVAALLSGGVWNLSKTCTVSPGIPVAPMLAHSIRKLSEIADKFQDMNYTCEYKYDGTRAQIHYLENGTVEIFSKGTLRCTDMYPDVAAAITRLKQPSVTTFIVDCEIVGYDRENHKTLSFQMLSTRAKKAVVLSEIKVNVCMYAFDILYLNGQPLLQEQLDVRRENLYKSFQQEVGYLQFSTSTTSNDIVEIQKFLHDSVNASCEGLMIKTLSKNATYEPSKRTNKWLKLKKDYMDSMGDSLDLVPIGAFHGNGNRTGVYGSFLLACYDADSGEFQSICKAGTGFSQAELEELSASLASKVIDKPLSHFRYSDTNRPDVWFPPTEVWEVKTADLSISPVYHAAFGTVDHDKGISLRFPRFIRVREDKVPEQATTSDRVAYMYKAQKINHQDGE